MFKLFLYPLLIAAIYLDVYHFSENKDEFYLNSSPIEICETLSIEDMAELVLGFVFDSKNPLLFIPQNVRILDIHFIDEYALLVVSLSSEATLYGGTFFEHMFIETLLANVATLPGVGYFTLQIENRTIHLPEGRKIFEHRLH